MTIALLFWILMLLWILLGATPHVRSKDWTGFGQSLLVWLAVAVLGWAVFGPMVK